MKVFQRLLFLTFLLHCPAVPAEERQSPAGLWRVHFNEPDFTRPADAVLEPQAGVDTGTQHSAFTRIWLGRIRMPVAAPVTFSAEADNGVVLTVDGRDVISGWHGPAREGRVTAAAGAELPVEVRYFQNGGRALLRLYWSWDGHGRELIPASAFSHTSGDRERAEALAAGKESIAPPVFQPEARPPAPAAAGWSPGPWLMLDEQVILSVDHLERRTGQPVRHGEPVVDGAVDGNFQPYVSVVRGEEDGRFRMWYNVPRTPGNAMESSLALIESGDGIHWQRPHRVLETAPIQFGASVIDEGPAFPDKSKRFKAAWYKNDGLQVSVSPDGETWGELAPGPLLRHSHDINAIDWDPVRRRYMAFVSFGVKLDPSWTGERRIPHMSVSDDLVHWRQPWPVIMPDPASPREQGETQFYCMAGVMARGNLLIGLVKVLRDDLNSEPGLTPGDFSDTRPHAGIGYTVLAWSHDGEHWRRDTEPFLDRNPEPGTWDRAHAWADEQLVAGGEVFLYYAGYQLGHKGERFTTRRIGLARMKLDRYAGYCAEGEYPGTLRTAVREWKGSGLTVNADVRGELRAALCEPSGKFIPGFSFADCVPVRGDSIAHPLQWKNASAASPGGRPVQVVFQVREGTLFAFTVMP